MKFVAAGRTFFVSGGPPDPPEHLWIIVTDPNPKTTHVVIVAVVTARSHTDKTVVLALGCHPFIKHDSNVDYGTARIIPAEKLEAVLKSQRCTLHKDLPPKVLAEVRRGGTLQPARRTM